MTPPTAPTSPATRPVRQHGGPPLVVLASVSLLLLIGGIALSAALGGVFPSPFEDAAVIQRYFAEQSDAVRAAGICVFASSVPLAVYAATAHARLRILGVRAPGASIALAGGLISAAMLSLSGLLQWVISRPAVRTDAPLVRGLQDLSFLTGGVSHVVFLGLLVAGIAVPALLLGLLPRPLAIGGLVIAAVAEAATVSLIWPAASVLLPLARFPGLIWLIAAGLLLPVRRLPRNADPQRTDGTSP
jgi:hypothetical protein